MSKILLEMKSPLVVLGKTLNNNYKESLSYISGDKVRAAFAKYILMNCPIFQFNQREEVSENKFKYNWVYYRNKQGCKDCAFTNVCKSFSNMKFSFFYPEGTDILPFTAMKCKYHKEHGFRDILIKDSAEPFRCKKCLCKENDISNGGMKAVEGRMEAAYGLRINNESFKVDKKIHTKNAINKYTKTSKESALYTVVAITNTNFEGHIEGIEPLLKVMNSLGDKFIRIGSYISVGMGSFEIIEINEENKNFNLLEKLSDFNKRIKNRPQDKTYIPMLLKSDTKLELEKVKLKSYLTDDEYRNEWKEILSKYIGFRFNVKSVYTELENYIGYDLSNGFEKKEEDIAILNKMGTTILIETEERLEDILDKLEKLQCEGIGLERENGFGEVEICNELHLKGEIYE